MLNFRFDAQSGGTDGATGAVSRRAFLKTSALAAGGFMLELSLPMLGGNAKAATPAKAGKAPAPSAFVHIAPDETVTIQVNRLDFGQGVQTALPMLIAEELDCDWQHVKGELAPAADVYRDPVYGIQMTGGSGSVAHSWGPYRQVGATARAMLIAAAAQRWHVPASGCHTENGAVLGPSGQRATYGELAADAQRQPVPSNVPLKDPAQFRLLGKPTGRLDARAKSTGTPMYGMDFKQPGMKVAVVARPPIFGGKIARYDASAAKAVKGVVDIVEISDDRDSQAIAVIADGYWPAKTARDALKIEWNTAGLKPADSASLWTEYAELAKQPNGVVARNADVSKLAGAPKKISAQYRFPYLAHTPMEPLNCTVQITDGGAEIWTGTQFQTVDQAAAARILGCKPEQVKLHTLMAGGGFGRRATPTSDYTSEAVQVAKAWHQRGHREPVKVIWSREDDVHGGYYRPMYLHQIEIGMDAQGNVLAWDHTIVGQSILAGTPFKAMIKNGVDSTSVEGAANTPYALPMRLTLHTTQVNVPVLWWRSVGNTHTAYVMETLIDELAHAAGQDPVAYRRKLLGNDHPRHLAALDLAVERSGYGKKTLPKDHAWGVAVHESFNSVVAYVVEATVEDGKPKLVRATAGVHCNFAVNPLTVAAQAEGAALMGLGTTLPGAAITLKDGHVEQSNFHQYIVARMPDMPPVDVHIVPSGDAPTGMGEPGLPALAPAYANAIAAVTGKRLRALPFDLQT